MNIVKIWFQNLIRLSLLIHGYFTKKYRINIDDATPLESFDSKTVYQRSCDVTLTYTGNIPLFPKGNSHSPLRILNPIMESDIL